MRLIFGVLLLFLVVSLPSTMLNCSMPKTFQRRYCEALPAHTQQVSEFLKTSVKEYGSALQLLKQVFLESTENTEPKSTLLDLLLKHGKPTFRMLMQGEEMKGLIGYVACKEALPLAHRKKLSPAIYMLCLLVHEPAISEEIVELALRQNCGIEQLTQVRWYYPKDSPKWPPAQKLVYTDPTEECRIYQQTFQIPRERSSISNPTYQRYRKRLMIFGGCAFVAFGALCVAYDRRLILSAIR